MTGTKKKVQISEKNGLVPPNSTVVAFWHSTCKTNQSMPDVAPVG